MRRGTFLSGVVTLDRHRTLKSGQQLLHPRRRQPLRICPKMEVLPSEEPVTIKYADVGLRAITGVNAAVHIVATFAAHSRQKTLEGFISTRGDACEIV